MVTKRLKRVELVVRTPLSEIGGLDPTYRLASAGQRPDPLRTPYGGCSIEVYRRARSRTERSAHRPWRKGTWLGHVNFDVRTDLGVTDFTPIPLTDELRERLGLMPGTVRYVQIEDPLQAESVDGALRLYVDESLLDTLRGSAQHGHVEDDSAPALPQHDVGSGS